MPSPLMLVAMKVRSFPNRDKEHKRIKDLADIAAMVMFSPAETIKNVAGSINEADKRRFKTALNRDDIQKVSELSGMNPDVIDEAISKILR
jgi:phage terminase Nu1 subunit (DNA packaging protein)